jgi:hypothetical protein
MQAPGVRRMFELNFWIWRNYPDIDHKILQDTHLTLTRVGGRLVLDCAMLMAWSWTGGFALASLSRRARWINGLLFVTLAGFAFPEGFLIVVPAIWGIRLHGRRHAWMWAAVVIVTMLFTGTRNLGWLRALPALYILGNRVYETAAT